MRSKYILIVKDRVLNDVVSKRYTIKMAKTEEEVSEALKLRYEVFNSELGRGFAADREKEKDQYDDQSHHLIVIDNNSDEVVGTYRLQTYEQANPGNGFVSDMRFHLDQFPDGVLRKGVEVGRACIHKDHRKGRVLFLLWKGFAGYLTHFHKRYLFGYAAFQTTDASVMMNTYLHLKEKGKVHPDINLSPRKPYQFNVTGEVSANGETDIPPLFQNYLDVGCYVCSTPSFDRELSLGHCMILLDLKDISDRTRKLFFG